MQELCDTVKKPTFQVISICEGEESYVSAINQSFCDIKEENFTKLGKTFMYKNKTGRTPNRQKQKRNSPWYHIFKKLNIQNSEYRMMQDKNHRSYIKTKPPE